MSQELLHDVLSLDAGLLSPDAWHALAGATAIEIRRGDLEGPLACGPHEQGCHHPNGVGPAMAGRRRVTVGAGSLSLVAKPTEAGEAPGYV